MENLNPNSKPPIMKSNIPIEKFHNGNSNTEFWIKLENSKMEKHLNFKCWIWRILVIRLLMLDVHFQFWISLFRFGIFILHFEFGIMKFRLNHKSKIWNHKSKNQIHNRKLAILDLGFLLLLSVFYFGYSILDWGFAIKAEINHSWSKIQNWKIPLWQTKLKMQNSKCKI